MSPPAQDPRTAYVHEVLHLYVRTPGVLGRLRHADRQLAGQLFDQGVPLYAVQNALILAAARRIRHNAFSAPLPPVRSLHYFISTIREVLDRPPGYREIEDLRHTISTYWPR